MSMNIGLSATSIGGDACLHCGRGDEIRCEYFYCWQTPTKVTDLILSHPTFKERKEAYAKWVTETNPIDARTHLKALDKFIKDHGERSQWILDWYKL